MSTSASDLDPVAQRRENVLRLFSQGYSVKQIRNQLGISDSTVRRDLEIVKNQTEGVAAPPKLKPSAYIDEDGATVITTPSSSGAGRNDAEQALRENGYDPSEFEPRSVKVNGWDMPSADGDVQRMTQFSVSFQRKREALLKPIFELAGQTLQIKGKRPKAEPSKDGSELIVIAGDNHCPNHDQDLHQALLRFLKDTKPQRFIHLGDLVDDNENSKYLKSDPRWVSSCAEDISASRQVLAEITQALPDETRKQFLIGNHEKRLRDLLLNKHPGLDQLQLDGPYPHLHWATLLGLPDLGWEYVGSKDGADYPYAEIDLAPAPLACIHGEKALGGAGNSVRKQMDERAKSYIQGHTHKVGHVMIAKGDLVLDGTEIPALAQRNLGYRKEPDHHAGFATVNIWPDGKYQIDIAKWDRGSLLWRGQRWDSVRS